MEFREGFKNASLVCAQKKIFLAEFYGLSGIRNALFWKNCLDCFITVRLILMQKKDAEFKN